MLTAVATLVRPLRLVRYGRTLWRSRQLRRDFSEAKAALGERMFAQGIDDGETGAKITALEGLIRHAESTGVSSQALKAERSQLVLQLAAAALEDDGPLPGADAEYGRARKAQVALQKHEADPMA